MCFLNFWSSSLPTSNWKEKNHSQAQCQRVFHPWVEMAQTVNICKQQSPALGFWNIIQSEIRKKIKIKGKMSKARTRLSLTWQSFSSDKPLAPILPGPGTHGCVAHLRLSVCPLTWDALRSCCSRIAPQSSHPQPSCGANCAAVTIWMFGPFPRNDYSSSVE